MAENRAPPCGATWYCHMTATSTKVVVGSGRRLTRQRPCGWSVDTLNRRLLGPDKHQAEAIAHRPAAATGDGGDYGGERSGVSFVHDTMKPAGCQKWQRREKMRKEKARTSGRRLSAQDRRYIHLLVFNYSLFISAKLLVIVCSRNLNQPGGVNESRNNGRRSKNTAACSFQNKSGGRGGVIEVGGVTFSATVPSGKVSLRVCRQKCESLDTDFFFFPFGFFWWKTENKRTLAARLFSFWASAVAAEVHLMVFHCVFATRHQLRFPTRVA